MKDKYLIVLPVYNREGIIMTALNSVMAEIEDDCDILIIDDGSEDGTSDVVKTDERIKYLRHEKSLGFGGTMISAFQFAHDLDYSHIITLDISVPKAAKAYSLLRTKLEEGDTIVSLSRYSTEEEDYSSLSFLDMITSKLNNITNYELVDPFSPFKAFDVKKMESMVLEEFDEAFILQLWIQCAFFGLKMEEIVSTEINVKERDYLLEKEPDYYLDFMEGEKLLYPVSSVN